MEEKELDRLARDYTKTMNTAQKLRERLYEGIYDFKQEHGTEDGWQTRLVKMTGLTRERIRQIIDGENRRRATEREG